MRVTLLAFVVFALVLVAAGIVSAQVQPIPERRVTAGTSPVLQPPAAGSVQLQRPRPVTPIPTPVLGPAVTGIVQTRASKVSIPNVMNYSSILANISFIRLPPGARVRAATSTAAHLQIQDALDDPTLPRCRGGAYGRTRNLEVLPESVGVVDAQGRVTLGYGFAPRLPAGAQGLSPGERCTPIVAIEVLEAGASDYVIHVVKAAPIEPFLLRTVRYDQTWALRRYFDFTMLSKAPGSTCEGTSVGPLESHSVGPINRNGDLVIQVRSGPLGTACKAVSPGVAVDKQIKLISIDWDIEYTGDKCCASGDCNPNFIFQPGHLPEDDPARYQDLIAQTGMSSQVRYPRLGADQWVMGQAYIDMECEPTLVNDHGVRLVLRSATIEAPPDVALP